MEHITLLKTANALQVASDVHALTQFVNHMLTEPEARIQMGQRAIAAIASSGVIARAISQSLLELMIVD
jgi:hypothetical protein